MEIRSFKKTADFRRWLEVNHTNPEGLWLQFFKKHTGEKSLTRLEALDQALCFGWIDGQLKPFDDRSWLQRFTPRRSRSTWSKINTQHAERLMKSGVMTSAGLKAVEEAKADGRWRAAYSAAKDARPPKDFLEALSKDKRAKSFFETLNRTNIYSIVHRLETAKKPETREKRMKTILAMLTQGKAFHPLPKKSALSK